MLFKFCLKQPEFNRKKASFLTIKITFRFVLIEVKIAQNVLRKDYISF